MRVTMSMLARRAARDTDATERQTRAVIHYLVDEIVSALARGDTVHLLRLGTFEIRRTKLDTTFLQGKKVSRPARNIVMFRGSKTLKSKVNE